MGVSVAPGATTLTVMPRGASSIAQDRARPTSAALVAAYWLRPAEPAAVRLPIRTMRPLRSGSAGRARRRAGPPRQRADATSPPPRRGVEFAETRRRRACRPHARAPWGRQPDERCPRSLSASPSQIERQVTVVRRAGRAVRLMPVTAQPSRRSRAAIAAPMPELAPVTTACGARPAHPRTQLFRHPHVFDRLTEIGEGDVQRPVRPLLDEG